MFYARLVDREHIVSVERLASECSELALTGFALTRYLGMPRLTAILLWFVWRGCQSSVSKFARLRWQMAA